MKKLRKHLTYSNVVGTLALFLVLTGATAFAASQLGKNSVGSKQLKKNAVTAAKIKTNAVTTAKIKKDAVTGAKVNEATLGTVPSANLANSIPPAEATHIVGASGQPAFEGGSSNLASGSPAVGFNPVGFYKDHEGIVHLQGIAKAGSEGIVFTLPPGFRPASGKLIVLEPLKERQSVVIGSNVTVPGSDLSGKVVGTAGKEVDLDSITFRAES